MRKKPFLTYDQLIDKLETEKKLIVSDHAYAIDMLKRHSYFALVTGYKGPFKLKNGEYRPHTEFNDIYALFLFDYELRGLFLSYILKIENHVKSLISYAFCSKHGELQQEYLNATNYDYTPGNQSNINKLINRLTKLASGNTEYPYINHQYNTHGNVPLWVMTKALTLGTVSKMYSFLPQDIQANVSKEFPCVNESMLAGMLNLLSRVRNVCAHNERLFDYKFQKGIIDNTPAHKHLCIAKDRGGQYKKGKKDLFASVITLLYLLDQHDFTQFVDNLSRLLDHLLSETRMLNRSQMYKYLGFPENWKDICEVSHGDQIQAQQPRRI